jgi:thiamine biosynthesis lipoprotein
MSVAVEQAHEAGEQAEGDPAAHLRATFRSMASEVRFWVVAPRPSAEEDVASARAVVEAVAASCTRFDPQSPLMRANAAGRSWTVVPPECFDALRAAYAAHVETGGLFDPRVLRVLTGHGYDTSLPFESRRISLPEVSANTPRRRGLRGRRAWRPRFDPQRRAVKVGPEPVDLGGIGKGLAVRWAGERLAGAGDAVLVEAGGDILALGQGPDGTGWMVGVEDPLGGADPVAVLRVSDLAVATSSTRVRTWTVGGAEVHHLVDPRSQRPAESGLASVTVVGPDPATAEVWSKTLFVLGRPSIRAEADRRGLAALWVERNGRVGTSRALRPHLAWEAPRER